MFKGAYKGGVESKPEIEAEQLFQDKEIAAALFQDESKAQKKAERLFQDEEIAAALLQNESKAQKKAKRLFQDKEIAAALLQNENPSEEDIDAWLIHENEKPSTADEDQDGENDFRYTAQLDTLLSMGFCDALRCRNLLCNYDGDIDRVVEAMFL